MSILRRVAPLTLMVAVPALALLSGSAPAAAAPPTEPVLHDSNARSIAVSADGSVVVSGYIHAADGAHRLRIVEETTEGPVASSIGPTTECPGDGRVLDLQLSRDGDVAVFNALTASGFTCLAGHPELTSGTYVVSASRADVGDWDLELISRADTEAPERGASPRLSADGSTVAYQATAAPGSPVVTVDVVSGDRSIVNTPAAGMGTDPMPTGTPVAIADDGVGVVWQLSSPAESSLFGPQASSAFTNLIYTDTSTGTHRLVPHPDPTSSATRAGTVVGFTADGTLVVFESSRYWAWSPATGAAHRLDTTAVAGQARGIDATGTRLVSCSATHVALVELDTLSSTGATVTADDVRVSIPRLKGSLTANCIFATAAADRVFHVRTDYNTNNDTDSVVVAPISPATTYTHQFVGFGIPAQTGAAPSTPVLFDDVARSVVVSADGSIVATGHVHAADGSHKLRIREQSPTATNPTLTTLEPSAQCPGDGRINGLRASRDARLLVFYASTASGFPCLAGHPELSSGTFVMAATRTSLGAWDLQLVSRTSSGQPATSSAFALSADGSTVAYQLYGASTDVAAVTLGSNTRILVNTPVPGMGTDAMPSGAPVAVNDDGSEVVWSPAALESQLFGSGVSQAFTNLVHTDLASGVHRLVPHPDPASAPTRPGTVVGFGADGTLVVYENSKFWFWNPSTGVAHRLESTSAMPGQLRQLDASGTRLMACSQSQLHVIPLDVLSVDGSDTQVTRGTIAVPVLKGSSATNCLALAASTNRMFHVRTTASDHVVELSATPATSAGFTLTGYGTRTINGVPAGPALFDDVPRSVMTSGDGSVVASGFSTVDSDNKLRIREQGATAELPTVTTFEPTSACPGDGRVHGLQIARDGSLVVFQAHVDSGLTCLAGHPGLPSGMYTLAASRVDRGDWDLEVVSRDANGDVERGSSALLSADGTTLVYSTQDHRVVVREFDSGVRSVLDTIDVTSRPTAVSDEGSFVAWAPYQSDRWFSWLAGPGLASSFSNIVVTDRASGEHHLVPYPVAASTSRAGSVIGFTADDSVLVRTSASPSLLIWHPITGAAHHITSPIANGDARSIDSTGTRLITCTSSAIRTIRLDELDSATGSSTAIGYSTSTVPTLIGSSQAACAHTSGAAGGRLLHVRSASSGTASKYAVELPHNPESLSLSVVSLGVVASPSGAPEVPVLYDEHARAVETSADGAVVASTDGSFSWVYGTVPPRGLVIREESPGSSVPTVTVFEPTPACPAPPNASGVRVSRSGDRIVFAAPGNSLFACLASLEPEYAGLTLVWSATRSALGVWELDVLSRDAAGNPEAASSPLLSGDESYVVYRTSQRKLIRRHIDNGARVAVNDLASHAVRFPLPVSRPVAVSDDGRFVAWSAALFEGSSNSSPVLSSLFGSGASAAFDELIVSDLLEDVHRSVPYPGASPAGARGGSVLGFSPSGMLVVALADSSDIWAWNPLTEVAALFSAAGTLQRLDATGTQLLSCSLSHLYVTDISALSASGGDVDLERVYMSVPSLKGGTAECVHLAGTVGHVFHVRNDGKHSQGDSDSVVELAVSGTTSVHPVSGQADVLLRHDVPQTPVLFEMSARATSVSADGSVVASGSPYSDADPPHQLRIREQRPSDSAPTLTVFEVGPECQADLAQAGRLHDLQVSASGDVIVFRADWDTGWMCALGHSSSTAGTYVFSARRSAFGVWDLDVVSRDTSGVPERGTQPRLSADGSTVLYTKIVPSPGSHVIVRRQMATGDRQVVSQGTGVLAVTADGRGVLRSETPSADEFGQTAVDAAFQNMVYTDLATGARQLVPFPPTVSYSPRTGTVVGFTADGWLVVSPRVSSSTWKVWLWDPTSGSAVFVDQSTSSSQARRLSADHRTLLTCSSTTVYMVDVTDPSALTSGSVPVTNVNVPHIKPPLNPPQSGNCVDIAASSDTLFVARDKTASSGTRAQSTVELPIVVASTSNAATTDYPDGGQLVADPGGPTVWETLGGNAGGDAVQCSTSCSTADPIDTYTGNYWERIPDIVIGSRGPDLAWVRTYNALTASVDSPLGFGWTHNWATRVDVSGSTATVTQSGGSRIAFTQFDDQWLPPTRVRATLEQLSGGGWRFEPTNGENTFLFGPSGRLEAVSDRNGNTATLAYDGSGRLVEVTDDSGRTLDLTYTPSGRIGSVEGPGGREVTYSYDSFGNLVSSVDGTDAETVFAYNGAHRITSITDARGNAKNTNAYDAQGRVVSQTDALGGITTFSYQQLSADQQLTTVTYPDGRVAEFTYLKGRLTSQTNAAGTPDAETTSYEYNLQINARTKVTRPDGSVSSATYDPDGRVLSSTDPLGRTTSYAYDAQGDLVEVVAPDGVTTSVERDNAGNIIELTVAAGELSPTTTLTYGDTLNPGMPTAVTDPTGRTTTFTYDNFGSLVETVDPAGNETTSTYNSAGDLISAVAPEGNVSGADPDDFMAEVVVDAAGRPIEVTDPLGNATTSIYDELGNLIEVVDVLERSTVFTFDEMNRLVEVLYPDNSTRAFGYDVAGRQTSMVDDEGLSTAVVYDVLGRPVSSTDVQGRTTTYDYDTTARTVTVTAPDGRASVSTYDAAGQLLELERTLGEVTETITYTYDLAGRRTSMTDSSGTSTYTYDGLGRLVAHTDPNATTVGYSWDAAGRLTEIVYPDEIGTVERLYDAAGRWAGIVDLDNETTSFDWTPSGRLAEITYPTSTGLADTFLYDASGRVGSISYLADETPYAVLDYVRDDAGRIVSETQSGLVGPPSWTYLLDALDQLTSAATPTVTQPFTYDGSSNATLLAETAQMFDGVELCWTAPAASAVGFGDCELAPTDATAFDFDARGNRIGEVGPTVERSYTFDLFDRLVGFASDDGTSTVDATYTFDGDDLRTTKTVDGGPTLEFVYDIASGLPQILGDGDHWYVHGPVGPLAQIDATTDDTEWLHVDQLGSVRATSDDDGDLVGSVTFEPYGTPLAVDGALSSFGFAGQYTDTESGLIWMRARFYDPATGQFISVDPLADSTFQPYAYADNNPVLFTDPTGLFSVGGLGSAIGAGISNVANGLYDGATDFFVGGCDGGLWGAIGGAASAAGSWAIDNREFLVHQAISIGVGVGAGALAVSLCAGSFGAGCVIFAGAAIGMAIGTPTHAVAARAMGEEVTLQGSLRWAGSSAASGATGGLSRAATGRGLLTSVVRGSKPKSPGWSGLRSQPFWGETTPSRFGGWHGGLG